MIRDIAIRCVTFAVGVLKFVFKSIVKIVAVLSVVAIVLTAMYFISEPFAECGEWYADNNIFPKALFLVLAPVAAALTNQIKGNLAEQAKLQEPRSVRRAFTQATDEQIPEMVMGWLTWLALTVGAIALGQIVGLFQIPNCPM